MSAFSSLVRELRKVWLYFGRVTAAAAWRMEVGRGSEFGCTLESLQK